MRLILTMHFIYPNISESFSFQPVLSINTDEKFCISSHNAACTVHAQTTLRSLDQLPLRHSHWTVGLQTQPKTGIGAPSIPLWSLHSLNREVLGSRIPSRQIQICGSVLHMPQLPNCLVELCPEKSR